MEDLVEDLTRGNVTEVKVLLASVVAALAIYQLVLIAIAYGKISVPFLAPAPAGGAHRAIGDTIVVLTLVVALMCLAEYGFDFEESAFHVVAGILLILFLATKIAVLRIWTSMSRVLPGLGITVFALIIATWFSSAGEFLGVA